MFMQSYSNWGLYIDFTGFPWTTSAIFSGNSLQGLKNYGISSCDFKNPLGEFLLRGKAAKLCSAEWHMLNVIHAVIISYLEIALLLFPARDKCPISLKWFAGGLLHQLTPESRIISPCEWTWSIIYTFALFYHISIVFYCASNDLYFFSIGLIYRKDFINKWSVSFSNE